MDACYSILWMLTPQIALYQFLPFLDHQGQNEDCEHGRLDRVGPNANCVLFSFYKAALLYKLHMFQSRLNDLTMAFDEIFQLHKHPIMHNMKATQCEFVQDMFLKACCVSLRTENGWTYLKLNNGWNTHFTISIILGSSIMFTII